MFTGPSGETFGYEVDLTDLPVSTENIFHNYNDREPATVAFSLSNGSTLLLFFPEAGRCFLIVKGVGRSIRTAAEFKKQFDSSVSFVPILGPVEHNEMLYQKESARRALLTHRASRNFRNIWYHYPEDFETFRRLIQETWPGMDIERPSVEYDTGKPRLTMFCPEERYPREIYWAGFGFQVWCQMLTFIMRAEEYSLLLIDEPDVYLHSDLQRQLVSVLKSVGPDIIVATHSTEIISEVSPDSLLSIDKKKKS